MRIKEIIPKEHFVLEVIFSNGKKGNLNMAKYLEMEAFEELKEGNAFYQVKNGGYFVEWANGADLSIDTIIESLKMGSQNIFATQIKRKQKND